MGTKMCVKCKTEKDISEFYIKKNGKLHSWCHKCRKEAKREWDIKNKNHITEYKLRNKEYIDIRDAEYREGHREELRLKSIIYNERLREKRRLDRLRPEKRLKEKERGRRWRIENRERYNAYFKEYHDRNVEKKAIRNLRNKVRKLLNGAISPIHSKNLVGCSLSFFKKHIESQFTEGMTWDNYGFGADKWNIHHTPPLASYDYTIKSNFKKAFHWSHSSPKWTLENISENSNYNGIRHYYKNKNHEKTRK